MKITPGVDLGVLSKHYGVRFVRKDQWWLTRLIAQLLFWVPFQTRFWTTIGKTIAYPIDGPEQLFSAEFNAYLERKRSVVEHEFHHIQQRAKWGLLYSLSYLLLPLPIVFAWFRFRWEREPYLYQMIHYGWGVEPVVNTLWSNYALTWPKPWMRRWFKDQLSKAKASTEEA